MSKDNPNFNLDLWAQMWINIDLSYPVMLLEVLLDVHSQSAPGQTAILRTLPKRGSRDQEPGSGGNRPQSWWALDRL